MFWHVFAIKDRIWHPLVRFCWSTFIVIWYRNACRDIQNTLWKTSEMLWHFLAIKGWIWHPLALLYWSHYMILWHRNAGRNVGGVRLPPGVSARWCDTSWPLTTGYVILRCFFVDRTAWVFWYRNGCRDIDSFGDFPEVNARCRATSWVLRIWIWHTLVLFCLSNFIASFTEPLAETLPVSKCSLE